MRYCLVVALLCVGCGDSPTSPTPPPPLTGNGSHVTDPLPVNRFADLALETTHIAPDGQLTLGIRNAGVCVSSASGLAWVVDAQGVDSSTLAWRIDGPFQTDERRTVTVCCVPAAVVRTAVAVAASYRGIVCP